MAAETKIGWAHHTKSPWEGCVWKHIGCDRCYAKARNIRWKPGASLWTANGPRRMTPPSSMKDLLIWHKEAAKAGRYRRTFPSLCDPFEQYDGPMVDSKGKVVKGTMDDLRGVFFDIIETTWALFHILLTKRPENIGKMVPKSWLSAPPKNVMVCVSASDSETLDQMLAPLMEWPGYRGLCLGPLLGGVDLNGLYESGGWLDWVIVEAESGPGARPCNVENIAHIVEVCGGLEIPCFVKQLGARPYTNLDECRMIWPEDSVYLEDMVKERKIYELKDPKGGDPKEWPGRLRVQKFPYFMLVPPENPGEGGN